MFVLSFFSTRGEAGVFSSFFFTITLPERLGELDPLLLRSSLTGKGDGLGDETGTDGGHPPMGSLAEGVELPVGFI
ncbi:MAG: hypothetical protein BGO14_05580 [Chlamydiales bacterium 38-26]|nr:MAG: hypothetical protein BGO14_05580 [Chlamydiales bacterium 38-26]